MKNTNRSLLVLLTAIATFLFFSTTMAQDPVKVAPNNYKVLLENERVRVLEFSAKPGTKIAMHAHPDHVVYLLGDATAKFTSADGKITDSVMKKGETLWMPAQSHAAEIVGTNEAHVLVIELK